MGSWDKEKWRTWSCWTGECEKDLSKLVLTQVGWSSCFSAVWYKLVWPQTQPVVLQLLACAGKRSIPRAGTSAANTRRSAALQNAVLTCPVWFAISPVGRLWESQWLSPGLLNSSDHALTVRPSFPSFYVGLKHLLFFSENCYFCTEINTFYLNHRKCMSSILLSDLISVDPHSFLWKPFLLFQQIYYFFHLPL